MLHVQAGTIARSCKEGGMIARKLAVVMVSAVATLGSWTAASAAPGSSTDSTVFRVFTLFFHWRGAPGAGQTEVRLFSDGTFTTGDQAHGRWAYHPSSGALNLRYARGCKPLYSGRRAGPGLFRGRQVCTVDGLGFGRWKADRTPVAASPPEAGTSSQPPA
jgi:hypothetical protein